MTTECPVCKDGTRYTNKGVKTHIGLMAKTDEAHRKYRDEHRPIDSSVDPLDQLVTELEKNWARPVYKETPSQMDELEAKLLEETPKLANPAPPKMRLARKLKVTVVKPKRWWTRTPKVTEVKPEKVRDPEDVLGIVTMVPALVVVLALLYKAATDYRFFIDWTKTDIAQLYFYVILNPSQTVSILILVMTGLLVTLMVFIVHHLFWRMFFKDLQIRYLKVDETTGELKAIGTSKEGRLFLTIGRGFWDRLYRKFSKKPVPDTVTLYFKRRGFVNPFKVLASCEKGYLHELVDTPRRYVTDGLFKRTLIATHMRRGTENHSTVWWFESGDYDISDSSDSEWYLETHREEIKTGLSMVGKACGMDSSIQKEQMKNNISFQPSDLIAEQKRIWELKKAKMEGPKPELSR